MFKLLAEARKNAIETCRMVDGRGAWSQPVFGGGNTFGARR
jgi:hypothetical protein